MLNVELYAISLNHFALSLMSLYVLKFGRIILISIQKFCPFIIFIMYYLKWAQLVEWECMLKIHTAITLSVNIIYQIQMVIKLRIYGRSLKIIRNTLLVGFIVTLIKIYLILVQHSAKFLIRNYHALLQVILTLICYSGKPSKAYMITLTQLLLKVLCHC